MKTKVRPYELFGDSLNELLAYVVGKAAAGDTSAIKAHDRWQATCPKSEVVIDVQMVVTDPNEGDDEHAL